MSKIRKLEMPPIKEAVFEIRFEPIIQFDDVLIATINSLLKEHFNNSIVIKEKKVNFEIQKDEQQTIVKDDVTVISGIVFHDDANNFKFGLLKNIFFTSKVGSYNCFEEIYNKFITVFTMIGNYIVVDSITRIGIRYINNIVYENDYRIYLENKYHPIKILDNSTIEKFEIRNIVQFPDEFNGVITCSIDEVVKTINIDIDIFSIGAQSIYDIVAVSEKLRAYKNEVFFSIITDNIEDALK